MLFGSNKSFFSNSDTCFTSLSTFSGFCFFSSLVFNFFTSLSGKGTAVPLPDKEVKKLKTKEEKKQNPEKVDNEVKQVSEFEKKDLFDPNNIAALIDKSKEETAEIVKTNNDFTQDQVRNIENSKLRVFNISYLILSKIIICFYYFCCFFF